MEQVLTQMVIPLIGAFVIGLIVGYLFFKTGRSSSVTHGGGEVDGLRQELLAKSTEADGFKARAAEFRALLSKRDAMVAERDHYLAELEGRLRSSEAEVMSLRMSGGVQGVAGGTQFVQARTDGRSASMYSDQTRGTGVVDLREAGHDVDDYMADVPFEPETRPNTIGDDDTADILETVSRDAAPPMPRRRGSAEGELAPLTLVRSLPDDEVDPADITQERTVVSRRDAGIGARGERPTADLVSASESVDETVPISRSRVVAGEPSQRTVAARDESAAAHPSGTTAGPVGAGSQTSAQTLTARSKETSATAPAAARRPSVAAASETDATRSAAAAPVARSSAAKPGAAKAQVSRGSVQPSSPADASKSVSRPASKAASKAGTNAAAKPRTTPPAKAPATATATAKRASAATPDVAAKTSGAPVRATAGTQNTSTSKDRLASATDGAGAAVAKRSTRSAPAPVAPKADASGPDASGASRPSSRTTKQGSTAKRSVTAATATPTKAPAKVTPSARPVVAEKSSAASAGAAQKATAKRGSTARTVSATGSGSASGESGSQAARPQTGATASRSRAKSVSPAAKSASAGKQPDVRRTRVATKAAPQPPDDLLEIVGVGPKLNDLLRGEGITTFKQLALLTSREEAALDEKLGAFKGRIGREKWVSQAKELHERKHGVSLKASRG